MKWLPAVSAVIVVVLAITDLGAGLTIAGFLIVLGCALFLVSKLIGGRNDHSKRGR